MTDAYPDEVSCQAMQIEEWEVLESIHPTICIANDTFKPYQRLIKLEIPVELEEERKVDIPSSSGSSSQVSSAHNGHDSVPEMTTTTATLSTLPALHLHISLPPAYPLHAPPSIQSLQASSGWVPPRVLADMKDQMADKWAESDSAGVLYTWVEWIRSGEFLGDVGLVDGTGVIRIPHPSPLHLLNPLQTHASSSRSSTFAHTSHPCAICISERKGIHCLALSCGHVFCRSCLGEMWGLHVKEGDVGKVVCAEIDCGKGGGNGPREASEEEVRAVLSEEEVKRWKWLKRKRDLERDPTMIHCPMEFCQEPVVKPRSEQEEESGWARLRTCHSCDYSFCAFCKRTWHGPLSACPLPLTSQFILTYLSAPSDSAQRRSIEQRYGRSNVLRLVKQHQEDQENKKWMDESTMACPGCEIHIEKSVGCNHMTCWKCHTHFCYRCGGKINAANPYAHFSTPHTPCFSKLFDFVPSVEDAGWQPVEAFEFI
ncbi:hypothetical protein HYDPIDRAFT_81319 [Hydnomerulius pinastri MD-312]|nr:hypothetical protein HYDPIDRAFT_81319 [Hydnomerulius pinastri MD-312]